MFNVYLNGHYHSTHETFTGACRHARMEAAKNQQAYFTVFEAGDEHEHALLDSEYAIMKGVPDYIITPHEVSVAAPERSKARVATLARTTKTRVRLSKSA